ncbi:MAG: DNA-directed RNA polymerase subunit B [Candidatus Micrarchaeia archaeon]
MNSLVLSFFEQHSIIAHQLNSYNDFIEYGAQRVIDSQKVIEPNVEGYKFLLGKIRFEKPIITEADGSITELYPRDCRLRNITYASPIYLEIIPVIDDVKRTPKEVLIGWLPVMVKSKLCRLYGLTRKQLIEHGEDPNDPGGYFIINGTEKALVGIEDLAPNKIVTSKEKKGKETMSKVFSTIKGFRAKCIVRRNHSGELFAAFPGAPKELRLMLLLKALGLKPSEITARIQEKIVRNDFLLNLELEKTQASEAFDELAKKVAPNQPLVYQRKRVDMLLDQYLLPHIGLTKESRINKAYYLIKMAERAILLAYNKIKADDKDVYSNKRVKIAGALMEELFKYAFGFLVKDIAYQVERSHARGKKLLLQGVVRPEVLTQRLRFAMATGNWIAGQTGVSQLLDRNNFAATLSNLRRLQSPLSKKHTHFEARDLHGSHWGKLCPNESPEGPRHALIKNFALMIDISREENEERIEKILEKIMNDFKAQKKEEAFAVYLNGRFLNFVKNGEEFVKRVREERRRDFSLINLNISINKKTREISVNCDPGRVRRPYIIVEDGKPRLTQELVEKLEKKEIDFDYLVRNGIVEYLDADEEENAFIAISEKDIKKETTHLEIDPSTIFGIAASLLPFQNYNSSPRITMASQMVKQGQGVFALNFNQRFDSRSYILYYPQKPLVYTQGFEIAKYEKYSSGQNLVVAVAPYYGYNMGDAVVVNKNAAQRGLARSVFYKTYETEERRYPGGQKDRIEIPNPEVEDYKGEEAYSKLGEDGIIEVEQNVNGKDVLVGKTSPPRFLEEAGIFGVSEEKRRDNSTLLKPRESGVVDSVVISESGEANKLVKVRIRMIKSLENGDKFASRHGQKGVVALLVPQEDMPFTSSGIVPDLIINPHAIPTRMTIGHLLETIVGKAACLKAKPIEGTTFKEINEEEIGKILESYGFKKNGKERMYDGISGKAFEADIYIGVIYYQKLYHMVSNKMHVRSRGPVQLLTHQPTEGRAREGGLRFGEMERDTLIGFGASALLRDRLLEESDKTKILVCRDCGSLAYFDRLKNTAVCPICGSTNIGEVDVSYGFKLLLDEIRSFHIFPRIKIGERE